MVKVIATKGFHGSVVNRDDLGLVGEGDTIEVSDNDAQYLVREGYAERVAFQEAPPVESTPANTPPVKPTTPPAETPPVEATTGPGT